jgi:GTP cyclohydrolase I
MKDIQSTSDRRGVEIDEVGIENLRIPIIISEGKNKQSIVAEAKMGINLFNRSRATHMSRFIEIAEAIKGRILSEKLMTETLKKIVTKLGSKHAIVEFSFVYFMTKITPVSKKGCSMDYRCKISSELTKGDEPWHYFYIEVPVATLCPCSKEISKYGAHNQRARVSVKIKSREYFKLDQLIRQLEKTAKNELFSVLKRKDEKYVTEKMYENPMFVEDIAREIYLWAKSNKNISDFIVRCKSYESIHNHNTYASIVDNKIYAHNKKI